MAASRRSTSTTYFTMSSKWRRTSRASSAGSILRSTMTMSGAFSAMGFSADIGLRGSDQRQLGHVLPAGVPGQGDDLPLDPEVVRAGDRGMTHAAGLQPGEDPLVPQLARPGDRALFIDLDPMIENLFVVPSLDERCHVVAVVEGSG